MSAAPAASRSLLVLALAAGAAAAQDGSGIVPHPSLLEYPELEFTPPEREAHRRVLPSGVPVYVVEDHSLPLVDVTVYIRTGAYLEPAGKAGLASMTGALIRSGGTARMAPDAFDEELAFLAANVTSSIADTEGTASFNCLSKDLDRVLELFIEMLRSPRFDAARLEVRRSQVLQDLARRNDETPSIESRWWDRLLRGKDFFTVDRTTKASIESIAREDMQALHASCYHPSRFIIALSGDIEPAGALGKLDAALSEWVKADAGPSLPPIPKPSHELTAGVHVIDKPSVNQGRASIGHLSTTRENPEYHALLIMNQILGGGGFTSRITSRVRSDKGLAYSAGSRYEFGVWFPGAFRAFFQSKSETVAEAAAIVLEETKRILDEGVTAEEVSTAASYAIGLLPRSFATPGATANTLASDEFTGRDPGFWRTYTPKIKAVTPEAVLRAARGHLHPGKIVILLVGNREAMLAGKARLEEALEKLSLPKEIRTIPLPDPLTLEPPAN